jgi:hypothetical protein
MEFGTYGWFLVSICTCGVSYSHDESNWYDEEGEFMKHEESEIEVDLRRLN